MEIRVCKTEDIPALSTLWKTVFGDSDEFIALFFAKMFEPGKSVLAEENGRVAAMAYAVSLGEISVGGKTLSVTELYAVATEASYRGRGLASALIDRLLALTADSYRTVRPAEAGLFAFYARFGYEQVFADYSFPAISGEESPLSAAEYSVLREKLLQGIPHIRHSEKALSFQEEICALSGGGFVAFPGGIAAYEMAAGQKIYREILPLSARKATPYAMAIPRENENGIYFGFAFE